MRHTNPSSTCNRSYKETLNMIIKLLDVELFACFDAKAFLTQVVGMETDPDGDIKRFMDVRVKFIPTDLLYRAYPYFQSDAIEERLHKIGRRTTEENYTELARLQSLILAGYSSFENYALELEIKEPTTKKEDNWSGGLDLLKALW